MSDFARQCRLYYKICLLVLAAGLISPLVLAMAVPSLTVSPFVWNLLQIGGLIGALLFGMLGRQPKAKSVSQ